MYNTKKPSGEPSCPRGVQRSKLITQSIPRKVNALTVGCGESYKNKGNDADDDDQSVEGKTFFEGRERRERTTVLVYDKENVELEALMHIKTTRETTFLNM